MNDDKRELPVPPSAPPIPPEKVADTPVPVTSDETLLPSNSAAGSTTARILAGGALVPGYEILHQIAAGGMGVVYKARHIQLKRTVALKMVLGSSHADPRDFARFVAEAQAVAEITHPNVIQVFDSGEVNGHPFMAMEY